MAPKAATLPSSAPLHTPRIVGIVSAGALLYGINAAVPRILPGVLAVIVLYVLLTNVPRFVALLQTGEGGLSKVIRPAVR